MGINAKHYNIIILRGSEWYSGAVLHDRVRIDRRIKYEYIVDVWENRRISTKNRARTCVGDVVGFRRWQSTHYTNSV